ncbi:MULTISPECIES: hypothetical protein [unclassified Mycolicibacterium]|uniref:hypothetical protein n=1 Tax=unclassified Mycolicibacterium TaxID=2636767 RepID=UPI002ED8A663
MGAGEAKKRLLHAENEMMFSIAVAAWPSASQVSPPRCSYSNVRDHLESARMFREMARL